MTFLVAFEFVTVYFLFAQDRTALFDRISVLSRIYPSGRKSRMSKRYVYDHIVQLGRDQAHCTTEKGIVILSSLYTILACI